MHSSMLSYRQIGRQGSYSLHALLIATLSGSHAQAKPLQRTLQALFCQVTPQHVLNMCDVSNIWHVPIMLEAQGAHKSICDILQLGGHDGMDLTGTRSEV